MTQGNWSLPTRWLHIGLALTVSLQLFISLVMEPPDEEGASVLARAAFEAHEAVGLAAVVIVLVHGFWTALAKADGGLSHLFPWRGEALAAVKADIGGLKKGRLPDGGPRGGLPGLMHGLGFLAVTGMAVTGALLFVTFPESGKPGDSVEFVAEIHELIANFVWVYWFGHVGLAMMHKWSGHPNVKAMFSLGS